MQDGEGETEGQEKDLWAHAMNFKENFKQPSVKYTFKILIWIETELTQADTVFSDQRQKREGSILEVSYETFHDLLWRAAAIS